MVDRIKAVLAAHPKVSLPLNGLVPAAVRDQAGFWGRLSYNLLLADENTLALAAVGYNQNRG